MKSNHPFLLWLLIILVITASFVDFLQAIRAIQSWNLLVAIQYHLSPLYPIFRGVLLGCAFLIAAVLLLIRKSWAPAFAGTTVNLAVLWFWLDRLVLNLTPQPVRQQIFAIGATLLILVLILGGLWTLQPYMILSSTEVLEESSDSSSSGGINEQQ
jgi:hypothetical protein